MPLSSSRLQRILDAPAKPFLMGDYISKGFEFMNRNFGMLLGFMLVSIVIGFMAQVIPFVGFFLSILISPVLQIGYAQFTYAAEKERRVDFAEFFKGFNKLGPLVLTYLITAVITLLACLPGILLVLQAGIADWFVEFMEDYPYFEDGAPSFESLDQTLLWLGMLLIAVGALAVGVLLAWALFAVWFFDVTPMEALDASRKLIARNWAGFLVFLILSSLIAGLGALLCFVGVLYTAPAMAVAQYYAFADATDLYADDEAAPDITEHFIA